MNAIKLLKADHAKVESLFKKAEGTDAPNREELIFEIKTELEAHAHAEETIFYPALQEDGDKELVELVSEALVEHQQAKSFLGQLAVVAADSDDSDGLLVKLIEDVRHHVEEEEGQMFPLVEAQFDEGTLDAWGEQMAEEKNNFLASEESAHA